MKFQQIDQSYISFTHSQDEIVSVKTIQGDHNWIFILGEFVNFLEGLGFIDVRDRVAVDTGEIFSQHDFEWYGPTFNKNEDDFKEANAKANLEFMDKL